MADEVDNAPGLRPEQLAQSLKEVVELTRLTAAFQPIGSEDVLYKTIKHNWFQRHKETREDLTEVEKDMVLEMFYDVDESLKADYFSKQKMPPDDKLRDLFSVWAWTGLSFDTSASDDMVLANNINNFMYKRCKVKVANYRNDLLHISGIWNEAKTRTERKLILHRKEGPSKRAKLDNVPWYKPTIYIRPGYKTFVPIPTADDGYNEEFFGGMILCISEMNRKFPNLRNADINKPNLRPASNHLDWSFKTAALIAYHMAEERNEKPLSYTVVKFGNTEKWKYPDEEPIRTKMKQILKKFFQYRTDGIFSRVSTIITDEDKHFDNCRALGTFLMNWRKKAEKGGNFYIRDCECTGKPSESVLTEHYLLFEAIGLWDRITNEGESDED